MKHDYIFTEIEHTNKRNIYNSRFDKVFTDINNHYERTMDNTSIGTIPLPTISNKPRKVLARYVAPEQPVDKIFKNIYKDNINLRNKINSIKNTINRTRLSLEEYHIKIVINN
jgi:hypothetical protein